MVLVVGDEKPRLVKPRRPAQQLLGVLAFAPPGRGHLAVQRERENVDCELVRRANLRPGRGLEGPGIIDDVTSTIFVPAGWRSEVDDHENLIMRRS